MGHNVFLFDMPAENKLKDEKFESRLVEEIEKHNIEIVFTYNYFPCITDAAERANILYVSWIYDNPHYTVYSKKALSPCNRIFHFDLAEVNKLKGLGIKNINHMPLGVPKSGFGTVKETDNTTGYKYDVTFVGSLYKDNLYDRINYLPPYEKGLFDSIINTQRAVYGIDFASEIITDEVYEKIAPYLELDMGEEFLLTSREIFINILQKKITSVERCDLLSRAGERFKTDLFSADTDPVIEKHVNKHGYIDHETELPEVYRLSKINLNITLRSITSGIPLRCLEIMSCGGFVLTNYQPELAEYFSDGEDLVMFTSPEDMTEKIGYYLSHDEERERIAKQGREKVREIFSLEGCFEKMLTVMRQSGSAEDENSKENVLVIYGVTYCYNILNHILENFGAALEKRGFNVTYYDEQKEGAAGLARFYGQSFDAVIGVQTYLFNVFLKNSGTFLFDGIKGPKFNIVLDHPGWLAHLFRELPEDVYVLTHDVNYLHFIKKYYTKVTDVFLFPPGGVENSHAVFEWNDREHDLVFIGTYGDFRKKCEQIRECNPFAKKVALKYLVMLKRYIHEPAEQVFARTLAELGIETGSDEEFLNLFAAMNPVVQLVMYYYREKTLRTLAEGGVDVEVWGETWCNAPFMQNSPYREHIHVHSDLTPDEAEKVLAQSKIALNIMAWHKAGFTERLANTMLSGTVMLSDESTYITEHFRCLTDGDMTAEEGFAQRVEDSEFAVFRLDGMAELPGFVKELLKAGDALGKMAKNGRIRCLEEHTWDARGGQFEEILKSL